MTNCSGPSRTESMPSTTIRRTPSLATLMLGLAELGWPNTGRPEISADEACTVAHFLTGEMLRLGCRFDLRLFVNKALPDYQQWKDDEAEPPYAPTAARPTSPPLSHYVN